MKIIVLSARISCEDSVRILKTRCFTLFARKNQIADQKLCDAIKEVESGIIDAELGGGLLKKRIAREGEGKSGGYRTIILYRRGKKAFFIFGFRKSKLNNIDQQDLKDSEELARQLDKMTEAQIDVSIENGELTAIEVKGEYP